MDAAVDEMIQEMIQKMETGESFDIPQLPDGIIEGIYSYAYAHYEAGKYQEALPLFRFLTIFDLADSRHWRGFGATKQMLKLYEEALEAYTMALQLDESDPYLYINAADCYFGLNDNENGLQALKFAEIVAKKNKKHAPLITQLKIIRKNWSNGVKKVAKEA